jgi:hypothetical protein
MTDFTTGNVSDNAHIVRRVVCRCLLLATDATTRPSGGGVQVMAFMGLTFGLSAPCKKIRHLPVSEMHRVDEDKIISDVQASDIQR